MSRLNTSNLYEELDRQNKEYAHKQDKLLRRKNKMENFFEWILEYGKIILLLLVISGVFIWKHDGNIIQQTKDYFENFGNPDYVNMGQNSYKRDVIVENKEVQMLVPVIEVQGQLTRDGVNYVVFKYENKVYTKTIGEGFADDRFRISNISEEEVEVQAEDGSYFYYSLAKNKKPKQ